jgi:hypothetical protein
MPRISKALRQAYEVQDFTYNCLMTYRNNLTKSGALALTRDDSQAIVALARAWDSAQDRVRINRGKPLPGSCRPEAKDTKKKSPWDGLKTKPKQPQTN